MNFMINVFPIIMQMPWFTGNKKMKMLLTAAVIESERHLIIVDTGYVGKTDLFSRLDELNFNPASFDMVINTHVHPDHTGNNDAFAHARIIVSKTDYEFARNFSRAMLETDNPLGVFKKFYPEYKGKLAEQHAFSGQRTARKYWDQKNTGSKENIIWIENDPVLPPFLDLWPTPGHTPGHFSVVVKGMSLSVLIAGDAMPSRLFWKRTLRENTPRYDSSLYEESKKKIEQFDGIILGGHDRPFRSVDGQFIENEVIVL